MRNPDEIMADIKTAIDPEHLTDAELRLIGDVVGFLHDIETAAQVIISRMIL